MVSSFSNSVSIASSHNSAALLQAIVVSSAWAVKLSTTSPSMFFRLMSHVLALAMALVRVNANKIPSFFMNTPFFNSCNFDVRLMSSFRQISTRLKVTSRCDFS